MRTRTFWVYIMANTGGRAATLYTGMTRAFFSVIDAVLSVGAHGSAPMMPRVDGRRAHAVRPYLANACANCCNDLERRVFEHAHPNPEVTQDRFTVRYRITRLVYYEEFDDVRDAIDREKEIKGWRRERNIALIESINPGWRDLMGS